MQTASVVLNFRMDDEDYNVIVDTVNATTKNESVNAITHPLVNGDIVADHIVRQNPSLSLNGSFALGGKQGIVVNDGKISLVNIQELFSKAMNTGAVMTMHKVIYDDNKVDNLRFITHRDLIITSIQWTENINSLDANFGFSQILMSEEIEYEVDVDDDLMPRIEELKTSSFSQTLLSTEDIVKNFIKFLQDNDLMSFKFGEAIASNPAQYWIGVGVGVGTAVLLSTLGMSALGAGIIGVVVMAVGVAVIFMVKAFSNLSKYLKFGFRPFDKYNDKEAKRFAKMIDELEEESNALNNAIKVYEIPTKDDFTTMLQVDDQYLIFEFKTNNVTQNKTLEVYDGNNNLISSLSNLNACVMSYCDCTPQNAIYSNKENNYYAHLVYYNDVDKKDLRNYLLVVSSINPQDFNDMLYELIANYLKK